MRHADVRWTGRFAIVILAFTALPAGAQTRAILPALIRAPGSSSATDTDVIIDVDGVSVAGQLPSLINGLHPDKSTPARVTRDGRFVVGSYIWPPDSLFGSHQFGLGYRDLTTGTVGLIETSLPPRSLVADPSRPVIYLAIGGAVGIFAAGNLQQVRVCSETSIWLDLSDDGSALYVGCAGQLITLDPRTGTELRRRPFPAPATGTLTSVLVSNQRIMTIDTDAEGLGRELSLYDIATGVRIAHVVGPSGRLGGLTPLPSRNQVVVFVNGGILPDSQILVMDVSSLAIIRMLPVTGNVIAFTRDESRAVVVSTFRPGFNGGVAVIDLNRNSVIASALISSTVLGVYGPPVLLEPPLAPTNLAVTVTGRNVALTWNLPAASMAATDYQLEVGLSPATTDIVIRRPGEATSIQVANVPSGTYYARVRGINGVGIGYVSQTVEIRVP